MKKYTIFAVIMTVAFLGFANASTAQADEATIFVPVSSGSNGDDTGAIIPGNQGTSGNETGAIIPSNQGTGGNETGAIIPSAQGSNSDESGNSSPVIPPVVPPVNPPVTPPGGGGSISSSGSFYGGFASYVPLAHAATSTPASTTSCPLITTFMKFGANNDGSEVAKLQAFLKESEGLDLAVNGVFDQQTEAAVSSFQTKYISDIMGPWGATQPSGIVYITTRKKINELACATPLTLTSSDLSIIDAYKQAAASGQATGPVGVNQNTNNGVAVGPANPAGVPVSASSSDNGTTGSQNVAAVANASILTRFWSFIVGLFHR